MTHHTTKRLFTVVHNNSLSLDTVIHAYIRHKLKTHKTRQAEILGNLVQTLGTLKPKDLTPNMIAAWRSQRPGFSDSSARRELGALVSALRWGVRHTMLSAADLPMIDLPPPGQAKSVWMTLEQEEEFWREAQAWPETPVKLFVALALDTAARKSAILGLTWDRVMLDKNLIDYREAGQAQTNKRRIPVPINHRLRPVLADAQQRLADAQHSSAQRLGNERVVGTRNIDRAFAQFAEQIGYGWVTPHICRHTWACLAAQAGMPMFHIAKMLGDTLATVEANYAHLAPSHLNAVANWRFQGAQP